MLPTPIEVLLAACRASPGCLSSAPSLRSLLRIAAGAVHGDKLPSSVPASHGYNFAAVVPGEDGGLRLRIWPRRWSEKKKGFIADGETTPEEQPFAEHALPGLRAPVRR